MQTLNHLRIRWAVEPLPLIMALAIIFRLLAVIFAKGWGMIDDHFIVIESAGSWTDGKDYNDWLPGSPLNTGPSGHNFFYPGLHYLLFTLLNAIGITDPQGKMYVVRLLHAALSLLTVYYGYRITRLLCDKRAASLAGILLAIFWFMPWMSVRNLVEMACVPFLVTGYWILVKEGTPGREFLKGFWAGLLMGVAVNIRPQTIFFPLGTGIVLLIRRSWGQLAGLATGTILCFALVQGGIDYIIWGTPFAEITGYFGINVTDRFSYINLPWYNYFLTILGLMVPPVSFFLFFGMLRKWKSYLLIFLPWALFFIFHSYFPNKQERFILPLIPFMIIMGSAGWVGFVRRSKFWLRHRNLLRGSWTFFWIINTILLLVFTVTYSKKARVEAMSYLSKYQGIEAVAVIDEEESPELIPKFYLGQWPVCYSEFAGSQSVDSVFARAMKPGSPPVAFVLFSGDTKVQPLIEASHRYAPDLVYETTIEPGFIDRFVHWLNPVNKNRRIFIYRNTSVFPDKIDQ